jgi:ribosomal protein S18 acetylase RimI-like enzyme
MNPGVDGTALAAALQSSGYTIDRRHLFYLTNHSQSPQRGEPLTILPARSSFKHVRAIAEEQGAADAELLHLDDSHTDAFIALRDGKAAAYLATLTMGEVGVIENLYVAADFRRQGIGRTMMACATELAARAQWRHVMMPVAPENDGLLELATKSGFVKIADWLAYIPAIFPSPGNPGEG